MSQTSPDHLQGSSSGADVSIILPDAESDDDENSEMVKTETLTPDQVLSRIGSGNVYLLSIWITMGFVWGLSAMPMMVSAFIMGELCVPMHDNGNTTKPCVPDEGSIAKEFDLIGERAHMADYTTSAFLFGIVVGSSFLPILSDVKGRRLVLLLSMSMMGIFGCASSFAPDVYSFTTLRFLQGIFFTGGGVTNWVLAYESIPVKLRSYTALVFGLMWVLGYCAVGPLAYWLPNWHQLIIAVSAPLLVFAAIYYFVIPESFHYLVSRGKHEEVTNWLDSANRVAHWTSGSRVVMDAAEFCANVHRRATEGRLKRLESSNSNLLHELLSSRLLFIYTLVMVYLWTCDTFVYYGLSLFSTQLAGDKYINYALLGLIEIPSYLVSPVLLNKLGRRFYVSLCHLLAAVSFFTIIFSDNSRVNLIMWLVGKFAISSAFTSLFVYASEVFPTIVRNGCIGVCSVVARLGGAFAPMVRTMTLISPMLPTAFFGICASIAAMLTMILPETLNRELPDTTEQMRTGTNYGATISIKKLIPDKQLDMAEEDDYSSSDDEDYVPCPAEDDDVSDEDENGEEELADHLQQQPTSASNVEQAKDPEEQKRRIDALWSDFLSDTGVTKNKATDVQQTANDALDGTLSNQKNEAENSIEGKNISSPNKMPKLATSEKASTSVVREEVYTFAGEEVRISRTNAEKLLTPSNMEPTKRMLTSSGAKKGGLSAVASMISAKKKKLSVLDKTAHDWQEHVDKEGLEDELTYHERSKDSYLDKQDFLHKADYSEFEKEKNLRNLTRKQ
ncbi:sugar transporter domain-containing protein [Ditylenchus destructor]|nr:sugar transporter domain-containing protein [Ditylenchus destructor]